MKNVYKEINEIQTHLMTWDDPFNCNGKDVIICVTGNPGLPDFYTEFSSELHRRTDLPVCVIGHAGHEEVPDAKSNKLKNREHLFNLNGQLKHKLDFIKNEIDDKSKLHLIGHSIGAWLIIELLHKHRELLPRVSSINLLFPTIQKMAESRNGVFLQNVCRKLHFIAMLFFIMSHILPERVRLFIVDLYLKYYKLPSHYTDRVLKYLNPRVGEKVLFLAYDEMDKVTTLNYEGIDQIKHLTNVIYSSKDGWAPVSYMEDLKAFQPQLQMKEVNINHAFVLKSSETVAEMVAKFIKQKVK